MLLFLILCFHGAACTIPAHICLCTKPVSPKLLSSSVSNPVSYAFLSLGQLVLILYFFNYFSSIFLKLTKIKHCPGADFNGETGSSLGLEMKEMLA